MLPSESVTRSVSSSEAGRLKRDALTRIDANRKSNSFDVELLLHSTETDESRSRALLEQARAAAERSVAGAAGGIARVDARLLTDQDATALVASINASAVDVAARARGLDSLAPEEIENQIARQMLANYSMVLLHFYNPTASPLAVPPKSDVTLNFELTKRRMRAKPLGESAS